MLLALTGWARPQGLTIAECSEAALDQALAAAVDTSGPTVLGMVGALLHRRTPPPPPPPPAPAE